MRHFRMVSLLCLLLPMTSAVAGEPSATLLVTAEKVQPAGQPILLMLTILNTGSVPIGYWWGGPGDYPDAKDFRVAIEPTAGATTNPPLRNGIIILRNGQNSSGAGRTRLISPGHSVVLPAAIASPSAGSYRIWIGSSPDSNWPWMRAAHPLNVDLRDDAKLASARQQELLARVRNNDHFAQFVARAFPTSTLTESLQKDLEGNDIIAAERAMDGLWEEDTSPQDAADAVAKAIAAHVKPPSDAFDFALMDRLLGMASHYNTAVIQQSVARAAASRTEGRVHEVALRVLDRLQGSGSRPLPQNPGNFGE